VNAYGLTSRLLVGDAENLPFPGDSFDLVYSWGVLHHTPNTPAAIRSVLRVLRPGGTARVMIYHKYSLVGYMLWMRYAALRGRPFTPISRIYDRHLESPGTKAYTVEEARQMFAGFSSVQAWSALSFGDLLQGAVGQRHGGLLLTTAKKLWPRSLIARLFQHHGLLLLVEAVK
jgi:ubiquinone/menaquinone biosynthesis C-methylase UbiE